MKLDAKIPEGPLEDKWRNYQIKSKLINPANKKKAECHCSRFRAFRGRSSSYACRTGL
jgi:hypothetical protein